MTQSQQKQEFPQKPKKKKKTETAKAEQTMHINQNKIKNPARFRDQIQRTKPQ